MRVFALSDLHVDYEANARWVDELSTAEYVDDVLILAGDVSSRMRLLAWCFEHLVKRFARVVYIPGNHELWVRRDTDEATSLQKFAAVWALAGDCGLSTTAVHCGTVSIVPLLGWYDYSFGDPTGALRSKWMDYRACVWPEDFGAGAITTYFVQRNAELLGTHNGTVISFSHFLPRRDLMPSSPRATYPLDPVMGTTRLEDQIRTMRPSLHVYGHSHFNRRLNIDGITYINNALGYPHEAHMARRQLVCVHDA
jgi:predicted phosphodiesterase